MLQLPAAAGSVLLIQLHFDIAHPVPVPVPVKINE